MGAACERYAMCESALSVHFYVQAVLPQTVRYERKMRRPLLSASRIQPKQCGLHLVLGDLEAVNVERYAVANQVRGAESLLRSY